MRVILIAGFLVALWLSAALAQTDAAALSATAGAAAELAPGTLLSGVVLTYDGYVTQGDIQVVEPYQDELFYYWVGQFEGNYYFYDLYNNAWRPGPPEYQHATLGFQGDSVEGWVRSFGNWLDRNHFFGADGVLYQRVDVKRSAITGLDIPGTDSDVIYTYFVNAATGERSDSSGQLYATVGPGLAQVYADQMADAEAQLSTMIADNPAYPMWQVPQQEIQPEPIPTEEAPTEEELSALYEGQASLLDLIEEEIGPLNVSADEAQEDAELEADETEAESTEGEAAEGEGESTPDATEPPTDEAETG